MWAFTSGAVKGHKSTSGLSVSDFLAHDINGLNSKTTVAKYRKAWKLAIERGFATDVKPGEIIDLTDNNSVTESQNGSKWRVLNL